MFISSYATRGQLRCFDLVCGQDFFTWCPGKCQNADRLVSSVRLSYWCRRSSATKTTSSTMTHQQRAFQMLSVWPSHVSWLYCRGTALIRAKTTWNFHSYTAIHMKLTNMESYVHDPFNGASLLYIHGINAADIKKSGSQRSKWQSKGNISQWI